MKKHLSVRYGTIQGCYWMGYAALMGYASVYLLEKGFTKMCIRDRPVPYDRICGWRDCTGDVWCDSAAYADNGNPDDEYH